MKIDPKEHKELVSICLDADELDLLLTLLKVEASFQIKDVIDQKDEDSAARTFEIMNIYQTLHMFENRLNDMLDFVINMSESDPAAKRISIVARSHLRMYKSLCTSTLKYTREEFKAQFAKYGSSLLSKIENALISETVNLDEIKQGKIPEVILKQIPEKVEEIKADEIMPEINIMGKKGLA